jgi:hypothetical protein
MSTLSAPPPQDEVDRLIEQFDPESNFRRLVGVSAGIVTVIAVALSGWHYYTAGFGLHNEIAHRAIHLSVVLGLCFLVFPRQKRLPGPWEWIVSIGLVAFYLVMGWTLVQQVGADAPPGAQAVFFVVLLAIAGLSLPFKAYDGSHRHIPWRDWIFAGLASSFSLYLLVFFDGIFIQRPGQHTPLDLMMGVIAIAMVIEATRRTMGIFLPLLAVATVIYGLFGPYLPGGLAHRGYSVARIVAHLYKGTEGIYGIPVGVVATFVFHFVLFGIMAQLTGLGQLFVNLATIAAGRFAGGPAKVSVVSSGLFGMISGSAIANTVTTGVMTIPLMKKVGFSPRFAGAVEASASCGGQVTPPIMGAAAFIMAETLGIPLQPADPGGRGAGHLLHYLAILWMVHLEAKRLKLAGMPARRDPQPRRWCCKQQLAPVHPAAGDGDAAAAAVHALPGGVLGHHAVGGLLVDPTSAGACRPRHERPGHHAARAGTGLRDGCQVGTGHRCGLRLRGLRAGHHHAHRHGVQVLGLRHRPVGHRRAGAARAGAGRLGRSAVADRAFRPAVHGHRLHHHGLGRAHHADLHHPGVHRRPGAGAAGCAAAGHALLRGLQHDLGRRGAARVQVGKGRGAVGQRPRLDP